MNYSKLLISCNLAILNALCNNIRRELNCNTNFLVKEFHGSAARVMAQRIITSFFKVSPPKNADQIDKKEKIGIKNEQKSITIESGSINGNLKKSAKRSRVVSSSESETEVVKSPQVSSVKEKKSKRQHIVSSGSESEHSKSDECSPNSENNTKEKILNSPIIEKPCPEENIKTEKSEAPKSKKIKSNVLSEKKSLVTPKGNSKSRMELSAASSDESPDKNKRNIKLEHETDDIVPEADYNPAASNYHPIRHACWRSDQPVPYLALARTLEQIEGTSARLKIVDILANYFRSVITLTPQDLLPSVYMCLNRLAPAYYSLELGIAETYLLKAVGRCTGQTAAQVRSAAQRAGDLGAAAAAARATQRTMFAPPKLLLRNVFQALKSVAEMTGHASVDKKISKIQSLFVACRHSEAKFLIRSLEGKLRVGLAEQSVLQALAQATAMTPPVTDGGAIVLDASKGVPADVFKSRVDENSLIIKTTYCECPNYELVIPALLAHGVKALPTHCRLTVGIPLKPMLAHPTKGVHEVFNRFEGEKFTCEWKYDGERAQIHLPCNGDQPDFDNASIFSRNQENNTTKYPDVLRRLPSLVKASVSSAVLDCEAVAYDTEAKQILPFQVLSTRKRKDALESDIKVQVCVFVFDLLLLNGRALVTEPLLKRRELLREHFHEKQGEWQFATSKDCTDMDEVQQFLEESVKGSCEGLMVKTLEGDRAKYDIARRSHNWLKLKKDYLEGCGDTLDLVIIGAYIGRGRRRGGYGGFLASVRDPETERYQAICKLGTGFTDEDLMTLGEALKEHVIDEPRNYYDVDRSHHPDVWLSAAAVWEVKCADLSLSPAHRAAIGLVDPDRGVSLRFPRFVRVRTDKTAEEATTAQQVATLYLAQDQVKNQTNRPDVHVDDFY